MDIRGGWGSAACGVTFVATAFVAGMEDMVPGGYGEDCGDLLIFASDFGA